MYIIAIAWIYVTFLMAATEASITAGVLTFVFYGLVPCGLLMWILGAPQRKRKQQGLLQNELSQPNRTDTKSD